MARKILKETASSITFNPATKTITFPRYVPQEHLVLITDTTANKVIYNFSDPSLGYTSYSSVVNSDGTELTTIVLTYNTAALNSADKIQVVIDDFVETFKPSEEFTDPVGKLRTSSPQALIDTDFEYGPQVSKWESLSTINMMPSSYGYSYNQLNISAITTSTVGTKAITATMVTGSAAIATVTSAKVLGNGTVASYTTDAAHNLQVGQYVTISGITTATGYNVTAAQVIAIPSTTTFQIYNNTSLTTAAGTATITTNVAPPIGTPINVIDTNTITANGLFVIDSRASDTTFGYTAKAPTPSAFASTSIFDTYKTMIINQSYYTGAAIPVTPTITSLTSGTATFTSSQGVNVSTGSVAHGLSVGNEISVVGTTGVTGLNGNFVVASVTSPFSFTYYMAAAASGTVSVSPTATAGTGVSGSNVLNVASATGISVNMSVTGSNIPLNTFVTGISGTIVTLSQSLTAAATGNYTFGATILPRPQGQVQHRAFDGGVIFQSNASSNNNALVRQTRRYFRYQSGKGIQMSSGTILKPTLNIDLMSASGTTIGSTVTVTTKEKHNLLPGSQVTIYGSTDTGYNGTYTVASVVSFTQFTFLNTAVLATTTATGTPYVSASSWNGAVTRLGINDTQNGAYWEFDGQTVYAVRRASVYQIAGRVNVTQGLTTVSAATAYQTIFTKQLVPGDYIVIRGQSYRVTDIQSDTSLTISPSYRGSTATNVIVSKTVNTKIPQSSFNIDKLDGTGPSGYVLDPTKMQMFFVDFSWYGAGAVRWGIRTNRGEIFYVHKLPNNNNSATAYLRSGNLPARYESATIPVVTQLTAGVATTDTTLNVVSTSGFPSSGTLAIRPGSTTNQASTFIEYVNYTGITGTTFTGLTRGQGGATTATLSAFNAGSNSGTVSSAAGIQVGQRVINAAFPENTFVVSVGTGTNAAIVLSQSNQSGSTLTTSATIFPPLSNGVGTANTTTTAGLAYTYNAANPTSVELAYPSYGPGLSHWGTSVIMDGRFDDDKSLLFTYGQTTPTTLGGTAGSSVTASGTSGTSTLTTTAVASGTPVVGQLISGTGVTPGTYIVSVSGVSPTYTLGLSQVLNAAGSGAYTLSGGTSKALLSIRIAPSVDNGIPAYLGQRELINRMQLILKTLDISLVGTASTGNVLVQAYLNGSTQNLITSTAAVGSSGTNWQNAIKGALLTPNSSLAQIADYSNAAGGYTTVSGGEVTGGFFVNSTGTSDVGLLRDLGNSILGGGNTFSNNGIYPDGPDVLTIVVTNVGTASQSVLGRVSWTEAQA